MSSTPCSTCPEPEPAILPVPAPGVAPAAPVAPAPPVAAAAEPAVAATPPRATGLRPALRRAFGGLPRQFWIQWTGTLINRLGMFVQPFLVLYLTDARGLSPQRAGLLIAVWGAGALVGPLIGGWLADRIGRRATMTGAMLASAVSLGALGAAQSLPAITIAALFAGITVDMYRPASSALVADVVPPADRARAYGLLFWAVNIGFSVAATAGGFLAGAGYGLLFAVDAATCAVFAALIWFGIRAETRPATPPRSRDAGYRAALRDRAVLGLLGLTVLYSVIYDQAYVTLPLAIRDTGLPASAYGLVIAVNGIVIVALQPFAGAWLVRFDRARVMAISGLVFGAGFAATGIASGVAGFAATVALWTLGEIGMAGLGQALIAELAPPEARGRYQGLFTLAFASSGLIGPVAGTAIYAGAGPGVLWAGCLAGGAVLTAGHLALGRQVRHRLAAPALAAPRP